MLYVIDYSSEHVLLKCHLQQGATFGFSGLSLTKENVHCDICWAAFIKINYSKILYDKQSNLFPPQSVESFQEMRFTIDRHICWVAIA